MYIVVKNQNKESHEYNVNLINVFVTDFLEGFEDHDESIPLRISHSKKPIIKHFRSRNKSSPLRDDKRTRKKRSRRRRRRSLHHVHEDEEFKFANYTLQAFGQTFNLHLTPYLDFISPHYTLEVIGKQENESKKEDSSPKHCFYSGYVNESLNSTATVSICNGLVSSLIFYIVIMLFTIYSRQIKT